MQPSPLDLALPLGESQVADRYRDRFAAARDRLDRLDGLMVEGQPRLRGQTPYLALGVVPESPGRLFLGAAEARRLGEWARRAEPLRIGGHAVFGATQSVTRVGVRRVFVSEPSGAAEAGRTSAELHADGAAYFGHWLSQEDTSLGHNTVRDAVVVDLVAAGLRFAALHATENGGTGGEALVEARLFTVPASGGPADEPMMLVWEKVLLGQGRKFSLGIQQVPGTVQLVTVPPSRHTVDLTAIASDTREWLLATRLVATDLLQAFGLAEVLQIGPGGTIRTHYWGVDDRPYAEWAESHDVTTDDSPVDWA